MPLNYLLHVLFGIRYEGAIDNVKFSEPKEGQPFDSGSLIFLTEQMTNVFFAPSLGAIFGWLWYVDPICKEAMRNKKLLDGYTDHLAKEYRQGKLPDAVFLQDILSEIDEGKMNMGDLYRLIYVSLGGGIDTVSITTTNFLQLMADNPQIQKKIQQEIDEVVPADRFVMSEDLDSLPYFWSAVKETQRFRKMFGFVIPRMNSESIYWRGYVGFWKMFTEFNSTNFDFVFS